MSRDHLRNGSPRLGRALLFAAFAGLGVLPLELLAGRFRSGAFGLYLLMLPCVALLVLAPTLRRGVPAAALALALCLPAALAAPPFAAAALLALVALGLGRSGLTHPRPLVRALALEIALGLGSIVLAIVVHDGRPFGDALAVWGFWLMQSAFALVAPVPAPSASRQDPFGAAVAAAEAVLRHGR